MFESPGPKPYFLVEGKPVNRFYVSWLGDSICVDWIDNEKSGWMFQPGSVNYDFWKAELERLELQREG